MKILDLHGKKHEEIEVLVENFVLFNDCPLEIITGNSVIMQKIVKSVLEKYEFHYSYSNDLNLGSILITDY